jgi:uncharacterized protein YdaU (DUF1376 family)
MMPVFTDALLGDTLHLSVDEFGAYCLILFATWRNNGVALPDDDGKMARICRVTIRRWREKLRPALAGFFDVSNQTWRQNRLEKEWKHVAEMTAKQSAKGKASALKRWGTGVTDPPMRLVTVAMPDDQPNCNPHTHIRKKKENHTLKSVSKEVSALRRKQVPPSWIPDETDRAYAEKHAAWQPDRLCDEAEHFRDYHRSKGSLFADCHAAWRTWVRNGAAYQRNGHPKPNGTRKPLTCQADWDAMSDAERREYIPGYIRPI